LPNRTATMLILFVIAFKRADYIDRSRAAKLFFSPSKDHLPLGYLYL